MTFNQKIFYKHQQTNKRKQLEFLIKGNALNTFGCSTSLSENVKKKNI